MSIKAHQVLESDFITKNDLSGNASDVLGGDGVVRNATFESLEVLDFVDPLNNSYIHSNWTQDIPSAGPTITEDDSKLLMSVASGSYDWFAGTFTAPNVNTPVEPMDFTAKIHVSGVDTASLNSAGITVHVDGSKGDFYRIDLRGDGSNYDISVGLGPSTDVTTIQNVGQDNAWLALARRGNLVMVAYSLNSVDNEPEFDDMTIADKRDWTFSYIKNLIALVSMSAATNPGFDTEFRNFSLRYKTALVKSRGYVGQGIDFHDNLNNGIIHNNWIEDIPDVTGTDPTITEDSEKLIFDYVGGQLLDWYGSTYTAPTLNVVLEPLDFVAKVFVDNVPALNSNGSALIHYKIGTKSSYSRLQLNYHGSVYRFHSVVNGTEVIHDSNVGQDYGWLAIARRGHTIMLFSSKNDVDNEPSLDDMTLCKTYDQPFDYISNYIALGQLCWNLYPATEIHYKKFSLVYNQINLYQNDSYLSEQQFKTDGTETPGATVTFALNKTPGGEGLANTPSGYHILGVFRNGNRLYYESPLNDELHYFYRPSDNEIDIIASGDEEEFEVALIESVLSTGEVISYSGHAEDTPPTSPTVYDDEFEDALNTRWSWFGAGEPSTGNEKWGLENDRLNMRIESDNGGGPTNFLTDLHGIRQDCPSVDFIAYAKLDFRSYATYPEAGLMISNDGMSDFYAGFLQDRGAVCLNARKRSSGSWTDDINITAYNIHKCVLALKWVDTGEITFLIGEDYEYLQVYDIWSSIGFTPTKIGVYATQNGTTALDTVAHFEWFRVVLL